MIDSEEIQQQNNNGSQRLDLNKVVIKIVENQSDIPREKARKDVTTAKNRMKSNQRRNQNNKNDKKDSKKANKNIKMIAANESDELKVSSEFEESQDKGFYNVQDYQNKKSKFKVPNRDKISKTKKRDNFN